MNEYQSTESGEVILKDSYPDDAETSNAQRSMKEALRRRKMKMMIAGLIPEDDNFDQGE